MNLSLNQRYSHAFFEHLKRVRLLQLGVAFSARYLVWFMMGILFGIIWTIDPNRYGDALSILLFFFMSISIPWLVTAMIQRLFRRPRPYDAQNYQPMFYPFVKTYTFPSGHATIAFAIVGLALSGHVESVLFMVLLIGACLVALGRVGAGVHTFVDIIAGAIIGFCVSLLLQNIL